MNFARGQNFVRTGCYLGIALIATAGVALLGGCKGNTTAAALIERPVAQPPVVTAAPAAGDALHADPLMSPLWQQASWKSLAAPINSAQTTHPCEAALLYDSHTLYVAFICDKQVGSQRDSVSLFLDSTESHNGTEMLQVTASALPATAVTCTWFRSATAAAPRSDGAPDVTHLVYTIPDWKLEGLAAEIHEGTKAGVSVWTAVLAIPLSKLPAPLQTTGAPGAHWKFNLIRTEIRGGDERQANLSPIYVDAQAASPHRLAELQLIDKP